MAPVIRVLRAAAEIHGVIQFLLWLFGPSGLLFAFLVVFGESTRPVLERVAWAVFAAGATFLLSGYILYRLQKVGVFPESKAVPSGSPLLKPAPMPADHSSAEKLPDGRTLRLFPPRVFITSPGKKYVPPVVTFKSEGGHLRIPTQGQVQAVRFLRPHEMIVRANDLPKEVPVGGDGRIIVKQFTNEGIVCEEIDTEGIEIAVELIAAIEQPQGKVGMYGTLVVRKIPGPENTQEVEYVQFMTENLGVREIPLPREPRVLRFIKPIELEVTKNDLPVTIHCGTGSILVKRFSHKGFTIEEQNTSGVGVRAEVYYVPEPKNLTISVADEQWTVWQQEATILELKLRIQNLTSQTQRIKEWQWSSVNFDAAHSLELTREVHRKQGEHGATNGIIDAGDAIQTWLVTALPFPSTGGRPGYTLVAVDEFNYRYEINQKPRLAR